MIMFSPSPQVGHFRFTPLENVNPKRKDPCGCYTTGVMGTGDDPLSLSRSVPVTMRRSARAIPSEVLVVVSDYAADDDDQHDGKNYTYGHTGRE